MLYILRKMNHKHSTEFIAMKSFLALCRLLSPDRSSSISAKFMSALLSSSAKNSGRIHNIQRMLLVSENDAQQIAKDSMNNIGSIIGELSHQREFSRIRTTFKGESHLLDLQQRQQPAIFFSGHFGNWEILTHSVLHHFNLAVHPIYQPIRNPQLNKLLYSYRSSSDGRIEPIPNNLRGLKNAVTKLKNGQSLAFVIDQTYRSGIDINFLGQKSKLSSTFIKLAKQYNCPLVPLRSIRQGNEFVVEVCPPIATSERELSDIGKDVSSLLQSWVKEYPGQWAWPTKPVTLSTP